jgi:nucleotide-binding universal stress UspA family protein
MRITHILMPYVGTSADEDLLRAVCRMARSFKAKLSVVHVIEVPMALPLEARTLPGLDEAESALDRAEDIIREERAKASVELLQARDAGHAILEEAASRGADLIFMERHRHSKSGVFGLGETVEHVLKHAACPVWVSSQDPS